MSRFPFRLVPVLAILGVIGVFSYAVMTADNNPPPANGRLPFESSLGGAVTGLEAAAPLSTRNLSVGELSHLLEIIVAETLSFNPSNYDRNVALVESYFTPQGYAQYKSYLETSRLGDVLKSRSIQSGAFPERPPLEINALAQNGVFKWLYEIPVSVGYSSLGGKADTGIAPQRFTLRLQLTRIPPDQNGHVVKIELWQILPPR